MTILSDTKHALFSCYTSGVVMDIQLIINKHICLIKNVMVSYV